MEKNEYVHAAGWWVIEKKGKEFILKRKTKDGTMQVVSSFDLGEAINMVASLGGVDNVRDKSS